MLSLLLNSVGHLISNLVNNLSKDNRLLTFFNLGLLMKPSSPLAETPLTTGNYFQFEYDKDYQRLQIQFFDFVDQHNLNGIMVGWFDFTSQ